MKIYSAILEKNEIFDYLVTRNLLKQYKQAKLKILSNYRWKTDFKERKPTGSGIFSFRINKQFRAFCIENNDILIVIEINNHQNY